MGLFDTIIVEMPLPDFDDGLDANRFQSKCTPAQAMTRYKFAADGQVYEEGVAREYIKDDSLLGVSYNTISRKWIPCAFTREITFYLYYHHEDYEVGKADAFDIGHIAYKAIVVDGKVTDIKLIQHILAKKLSDKELKERLVQREESAKAAKERMVKYRKEFPTPTQALIDNIANLIDNRPAIFDQIDTIKIINDIDVLIKDWRDKHDIWYEK